MQWLVRDARPNDSLFFHCASRALTVFPSPSLPPADPPALARLADSGHGGQQRATEGDEADGMDENIYPLDHKTAGTIVDNDMHRIMVTPLPQGCRLTAIFDCVRPRPSPLSPSCACRPSSVPSLTPSPSSLRPQCHSGSALDLPYTYSTKGVLKEPNMLADAGSGALGAATSYLRGDMGGVFKSLTSVGKRIMNGDKATEVTKQTRSSAADVITLSGSKDSQTSADANIGGQVRRPRRCGPSPLIEEALWGLSDLRELPRPSHDVHKVLTLSLTLCAGDRSDVVELDLVLDQVPSCVVRSLLGLLLSPLSPASAPSFPSSTCARHVLSLILLRWCRANLAVRPPLLLPLPRRPRTHRADSLSPPAARSQLLNTIRDEIKKYEQKPQLAWCVSLPLLAPPLQLDEAELTLLHHCPAARTRWTSTSLLPSEPCLPHEASRYARVERVELAGSSTSPASAFLVRLARPLSPSCPFPVCTLAGTCSALSFGVHPARLRGEPARLDSVAHEEELRTDLALAVHRRLLLSQLLSREEHVLLRESCVYKRNKLFCASPPARSLAADVRQLRRARARPQQLPCSIHIPPALIMASHVASMAATAYAKAQVRPPTSPPPHLPTSSSVRLSVRAEPRVAAVAAQSAQIACY